MLITNKHIIFFCIAVLLLLIKAHKYATLLPLKKAKLVPFIIEFEMKFIEG